MDKTFIITIPPEFLSNFLGTLVLDILHDSKGKGYLNNHYLYEITKLLTKSCEAHLPEGGKESGSSQSVAHRPEGGEEINQEPLDTIIFVSVYLHFYKMWKDNPSALGSCWPADRNPDFSIPFNNTKYWEFYKKNVKLPIRMVIGRGDTRNFSGPREEDTFISLGTHKKGIEAESYLRNLEPTLNKTTIFESPCNILNTQDFYIKSQKIVDHIHTHLPESRIVLDMKSAAGLLRSVTDPIGYITPLPTFTDPGYNMPGMSAIRKNSVLDFMKASRTDFNYEIRLLVPLESEFKEVLLLRVEYYKYNPDLHISKDQVATSRDSWGPEREEDDSPVRDHTFIKILNDYHYSFLPRASKMAETLNTYLKFVPEKGMVNVTRSVKEVLINIKNSYYFLALGQTVALGSKGKKSEPLGDLEQFCSGLLIDNFNNYSSKLSKFFKIHDWTVPETSQMKNFYESKNNIVLLLLLIEYYNLWNIFDTDDLYIDGMWAKLPKVKVHPGFVYNFINTFAYAIPNIKRTKFYKTSLAAINKPNLDLLPNLYLDVFKKNFSFNEDLDFTDSITDSINLDLTTYEYLMDYLKIINPKLFYISQTFFNKTNFIHYTILDILIENIGKEDTEFTFPVPATREQVESDAIFQVLGKFSGDFGQIAWSIANNQIFCSEDNNCSSFALILHQLPKSSFTGGVGTNRSWGSIHGMGDGGSINITLS